MIAISIPLDISVGEDVNDIVREQIVILQRAVSAAADAYHSIIRRGNSLTPEFLEDLDKAVGHFTPQQKKLLKSSASPKADLMDYDPNNNATVRFFLERCFADASAHVLSLRIEPYSEITKSSVLNSLHRTVLSHTGLNGVRENFNMFLQVLDPMKSNYEALSAAYKKSIDSMAPAIASLAQELNIDDETLQGMKTQASHYMNDSKSMDYIRPISPSEWHI